MVALIVSTIILGPLALFFIASINDYYHAYNAQPGEHYYRGDGRTRDGQRANLLILEQSLYLLATVYLWLALNDLLPNIEWPFVGFLVVGGIVLKVAALLSARNYQPVEKQPTYTPVERVVSPKLDYKIFPQELQPYLKQLIDEIDDPVGGAAGLQADIRKLMELLPPRDLVTVGHDGIKWGTFIEEHIRATDDLSVALARNHLIEHYHLLGDISFKVTIPRHLRTEHTAIFAASGHGKTQTIQSMILDDLDHAIIVIDSQNQMIDALATRLPPDRLVYIEPQYCPPGLNPFVVADDEQSITEGLSLFEYIAGAIDSQLTGKQQMVYRFAARLCFAIPGATLTTLRQILEGTYDYAPHLHTLDDTSRDFITNQLPDRHYSETKKEIVRRLYQVLGNPTLNRIFSTKTLDLVQAINERKVVLVSTNNAFLQSDGAALLGRLVISEVMKAIRKSTKTAYLYIDEFHEYVSEESTLDQLFRQARKYQLGITVATQELRGLPDKLLNVITANTAIKLAGGLNARDAKQLAADMRVEPQAIQQAPTGTFMLYAKGYGSAVYQTDFGRLEKRPIITPLSAIRERFAPPFPTEDTPIFKAVAEKEGPYDRAGEIERSEW